MLKTCLKNIHSHMPVFKVMFVWGYIHFIKVHISHVVTLFCYLETLFVITILSEKALFPFVLCFLFKLGIHWRVLLIMDSLHPFLSESYFFQKWRTMYFFKVNISCRCCFWTWSFFFPKDINSVALMEKRPIDWTFITSLAALLVAYCVVLYDTSFLGFTYKTCRQ